MKKKTFERKLFLKKETLANLDNGWMAYNFCDATGGTCKHTCPGCTKTCGGCK